MWLPLWGTSIKCSLCPEAEWTQNNLSQSDTIECLTRTEWKWLWELFMTVDIKDTRAIKIAVLFKTWRDKKDRVLPFSLTFVIKRLNYNLPPNSGKCKCSRGHPEDLLRGKIKKKKCLLVFMIVASQFPFHY